MERERIDETRSISREHESKEVLREDDAAPERIAKPEPLEIDLWPFGANRGGAGGFGGGRN